MRVNDRPIGMVDPAKRRMRKDDMAAPAVTLTADIADSVLKKANKMKENIKKGRSTSQLILAISTGQFVSNC